MTMTPTNQTPSECKYYKDRKCKVHGNMICVNTLFSVRYGYQKPDCPDYLTKLRIPPVPAEVVLHGAGVIMDGIRSMAATFEEISQVMSRIASRPVSTAVLENLAADMKALRDTCQPTGDLCCHFRNHPPRCQLTKRPISPRQFSCKKYSLKYNPHK